eukprot:TRINITY_DN106741_c0_g1_i1.p1 TRINITY_DN106741_c0_g1~~TRINITY_DN106741_c0_g1_i1.p1  ORF type:complete len:242 (-),score=27.19 TRINITY_DN106741_c0_g1_i1:46-684(-)
MEEITEPMYCDQPWTLSFPPPKKLQPLINMRFCICLPPCCCMGWMTYLHFQKIKIHGIPKDAKPLGNEEKVETLKVMEGSWKVKLLSAANFTYEDAQIRGDVLIWTGGFHMETVHNANPHQQGGAGAGPGPRQVKRPNQPQRQPLRFFKDSASKIYIDFIGSYIVMVGEGEIEIQGGWGPKILLQRHWKQQGLPPPQEEMAQVVVIGQRATA